MVFKRAVYVEAPHIPNRQRISDVEKFVGHIAYWIPDWSPVFVSEHSAGVNLCIVGLYGTWWCGNLMASREAALIHKAAIWVIDGAYGSWTCQYLSNKTSYYPTLPRRYLVMWFYQWRRPWRVTDIGLYFLGRRLATSNMTPYNLTHSDIIFGSWHWEPLTGWNCGGGELEKL